MKRFSMSDEYDCGRHIAGGREDSQARLLEDKKEDQLGLGDGVDRHGDRSLSAT